MRYLDDIAVGDRFESATHRMDTDAIVAFARQFDPQPFHLGEEQAAGSFFGRLVASGWHTASVTMRLIVETHPFVGGVVGAGGTLTWPRPTYPGDTLRVVAEVIEVRPSRTRPERGMVAVRALTLNQHDEVVQDMTTQLVVPRSRAAESVAAPSR